MPEIISLSVDSKTADSITLAYEVNVASGAIYAVAVPEGQTAPSKAQIKAGVDAADVAAPSSQTSISSSTGSLNQITGLTYQAYEIYAYQDISIEVSNALFYDNFATGDRSHTENGFEWTLPSTPQTTVQPHANPYSSSYGLEFDWDGSPIAEQDWVYGAYYNEVWIRVNMYFHPNFTLPSSPIYGRNKVLKSWYDDYQYCPTSWGLIFDCDGAGQEAWLAPSFGRCSLAGGEGIGPWGAPYSTGFITQSTTPGTEREYVYHIKVDTVSDSATSPSYTGGGGNGVIQCWADGTLIMDHQDITCAPIDGTSYGVNLGYIWGAWNAAPGYPSTITMRRFEFATTDIWGVSS